MLLLLLLSFEFNSELCLHTHMFVWFMFGIGLFFLTVSHSRSVWCIGAWSFNHSRRQFDAAFVMK
jgi:hypothetical protein